jgi:hypothetical protein
MRERSLTPSHNALHQIFGYLERWPAFGGIQHAQPAAGASSNVEQPTAGAKAIDDGIYGLANAANFRCDGRSHALIFGVDDAEHSFGRLTVDAVGSRVRLLSKELMEQKLF